MKIAIFGLGYVGISAAACLTSRGHHVIGVDTNAEKVAAVKKGQSPIVEPGVPEMLKKAAAEGLLRITMSTVEAVAEADVVFVCVGTPSSADGSHNMTFIAEVTKQIAAACEKRRRPLTVAYRSTIKPGTLEGMVIPMLAHAVGSDFEKLIEVVYNPEFLREGTAVEDFFHPPKIVVGTVGGKSSEAMKEVYAGIEAPYFEIPLRDSEIIKFVDNTWHALKVAFANEVGRVCHGLGIDAMTVHQIFKVDTKLNISEYYTRPGAPFGGSCLPKDLRAFAAVAQDAGISCEVVRSIGISNEQHKEFQFQRVKQLIKPGCSVLLVGIAFKADTDDLRESPSIDLARRLLNEGVQLKVYDPGVAAQNLLGQNLGYAFSKLPALAELMATEEEVRNMHFDLVLRSHAKNIDVPVEGRRHVNLNRIGVGD
ncbi:nucleotide sugar dehydrogenase [Ramlibacter sp. MMS24-I3-19]|uniref:nucleotide sugar dehydrogenase n=1 Tax=Ramlibacter sp. MMS24-I3-19 TaxID=3416606 RepID=UPI003CFF9B67